MLIAIALVPFVFELSNFDITMVYQDSLATADISILKFLQFFNSFGLFLVPGLLLYFLFQQNQFRQHLAKASSAKVFFLTFLIALSSLPVVGFLGEWNASLELPNAFQALELWMKNAEEKAAMLTEAFLQMQNPKDLVINLILIAMLPAIGEELVFRGVLQTSINEGLKNKHWGVWIAAFLFSAIHFQFYGFFPRMLLGAVFGYLFLWSKDIRMPIFAHFLNNGIAVLFSYFFGYNSIDKQLEENNSTLAFSLFLLSSLAFSFFIFLFRKTALESKSTSKSL